MNLPRYIKEKRAQFKQVGTGSVRFMATREEAWAFIEVCLTQLVEKMQEELPKEFYWPHEVVTSPTSLSFRDGFNYCLAETRHRFHLFKTGEEHTGV